jgi:hypothetical protein
VSLWLRRRRTRAQGSGGGGGTTPDAGQTTFVNGTFAPAANGAATAGLTYTSRSAGGTGIPGRSIAYDVVYTAVDVATSTVAASPSTVDNGAPSTITITLLDATGQPLVGVPASQIVVASSGTGNTITQPTGVTNAAGQITATLSSTVEADKVVSVTACGVLVTDTATVAVGAGGGGSLVAAIDWNSGLGSTLSALQDSSNPVSFDQSITCGGLIADVMQVVSASAEGITPWPTANAMRLTARGESFCGNVEWSCSTGSSAQNPNGTGGNRSPIGLSQSHYARLYFRVQTGFRDNHGISYNAGGTDGIQFVPLSIDPAGGGPTPTIKPTARGLVTGYPLTIWVPGTLGGAANNFACTPMARYRYEWHLEYITSVRFRIWPRLYNEAGTLLFDANTFFRVDNPATAPNSLAAWYDIGGANRYFEMSNAEIAREFSIGHEGPGGSTDTGAHWYLGAVRFSTADWVGA